MQNKQPNFPALNDAVASSELTVAAYNSWTECCAEIKHILATSGNVNPFISIGWMEAWWQQWGQGKTLRVIVVSHNGTPVGFAPLYFTTSFGFREYFFVGHRKANYLELVHLPGYGRMAVNALIGSLGKDGYPTLGHFIDLNSESETFAALQLLSSASECEITVDLKWLYPCPYARFSGDKDLYYSTVMRRKRQMQVSTAEHRLESLGRLSLNILTTTEDIKVIWPDLQRMHQERFYDNYNPSLEARHNRFMENIMEVPCGVNPVIAILQLDTVPIAFMISFKRGDSIIDYIPALDPALKRYSPGHVLIKRLTGWMITKGFHTLDFSKGEDVYKRRWSNGQTDNYLATITINPTLALRIYQYFISGKDAIHIAIRQQGYGRAAKRLWGTVRNIVRINRQVVPKVRTIDAHPSNFSKPFRYKNIVSLPVLARQALSEFAYSRPGIKLSRSNKHERKAILFDFSEGQGIEVSW